VEGATYSKQMRRTRTYHKVVLRDAHRRVADLQRYAAQRAHRGREGSRLADIRSHPW
jgi:hypothetical protein